MSGYGQYGGEGGAARVINLLQHDDAAKGLEVGLPSVDGPGWRVLARRRNNETLPAVTIGTSPNQLTIQFPPVYERPSTLPGRANWHVRMIRAADAAQATWSYTGGGGTLTITIPEAVAAGADGNGWSVFVGLAAAASATVNAGARRLQIGRVNASTITDIAALVNAIAGWAGSAVVTGTATAAFAGVAANFAGGVTRPDVDTFFQTGGYFEITAAPTHTLEDVRAAVAATLLPIRLRRGKHDLYDLIPAAQRPPLITWANYVSVSGAGATQLGAAAFNNVAVGASHEYPFPTGVDALRIGASVDRLGKTFYVDYGSDDDGTQDTFDEIKTEIEGAGGTAELISDTQGTGAPVLPPADGSVHKFVLGEPWPSGGQASSTPAGSGGTAGGFAANYPQRGIFWGRFPNSALRANGQPPAPVTYFDPVHGPAFTSPNYPGPWQLPAFGVPAGADPLWRAEIEYFNLGGLWFEGNAVMTLHTGRVQYARDASGSGAADAPFDRWRYFRERDSLGAWGPWTRRGQEPGTGLMVAALATWDWINPQTLPLVSGLTQLNLDEWDRLRMKVISYDSDWEPIFSGDGDIKTADLTPVHFQQTSITAFHGLRFALGTHGLSMQIVDRPTLGINSSNWAPTGYPGGEAGLIGTFLLRLPEVWATGREVKDFYNIASAPVNLRSRVEFWVE